jgi:tetratricopeptide (TPR) repeat protein
MKPTIISNLHLYWFGSVSKNNQTFLNAPLLLLAAVCLATSLGSTPAAAQSVYPRSDLPHQRLAAASTQPSSPSLNPTVDASKSPGESLNSNLNAQWMFEILLGEMYNLQGSTAKGYSLLLDVAKKSGDEKLFERAVELALQARSGEAALEAAKAWSASNPKSKSAQLYVFQIVLALGRVNESEPALQKLIQLTPKEDLPDMLRSIPHQYSRVENKSTAAQIVEHALESFKASKSVGATAWSVIGQMRLMAKNSDGSMQAVVKGHAVDPKAMDPLWLALALMEERNSEAESFLGEVLKSKSNSISLDFKLSHARVHLSQMRLDEGIVELTQLVKEHPTYAKAWIFLASAQSEKGHDRESQKAWMSYLDLKQTQTDLPSLEVDQAYLGLSQIETKQGHWTQAMQWLEKVSNEKNSTTVTIQKAQILNRQGKSQEANALLESLPEDSAQAQRLKLMTQVQLLRDQDNALKALKLLKQAAQAEPENDDLAYEVAMTYEKLGLLSDMEKVLQDIISHTPTYHAAYNALGYSLTEHNQRLPEARGLIVKALELAPEDAFIMDSLGWVEFKLNHLQESLAILKKAYELRADSDIAAHLGEVLFVLDQKEAAQRVFKEGLQNSPLNTTLNETVKRLGVAL